ncbi:MAG: EF-hand domain-containing protein [Gemmataceae bacterium]
MRFATPSALAAFTLALLGGGGASAQPGGHRFDASFNQADRNKDGFLDAAELARAFRGPTAKVIADKVGAKEIHPDHAFLDAWDANKDGKISHAEFERYESAALASARAAANRGRTYTRGGRVGYRVPLRHRSGVGRAYGTNPYTAALRYQQRAYQRQRAAYSNLRRYGVYTPSIRGGYRGALTHRGHHGRR